MYITSGLFDTREQAVSSPPCHPIWSTVASAQQEQHHIAGKAGLGKRKRADVPKELEYALSTSPKSKHHYLHPGGISSSTPTLSILPSPPHVRATQAVIEHFGGPPPLKTRRRLVSLRAYRRQPQPQPTNTTPSLSITTATTATSHILKPCHVCRKSPTRKRDLDAYADCARCGGRACYVCMRQCGGSSGCGERRVCSACCVERGEEGEASCLDCLEAEGEVERRDDEMWE